MGNDERITWRQAERDAREAARDRFADAVRHGEDLDYAEDYAHEYADGCADVIYTYRAREIWMDSAEVRDCEDALDEMHAPYGVDRSVNIDERIALCVYVALRDAFADEWRTAHETADDEDDAEVIA